MAKKNNPIIGCLFLIVVAVGAGVQLFKYNPVAGIAGVIGIVFLGGLPLYAMRRKRCEVCGNFLERKKFFWNIDGEKKEYVRTAIKHSCEGRVEQRREISDERKITGTGSFRLDPLNGETSEEQALCVLRSTGARNKRSRNPAGVISILKIEFDSSAVDRSIVRKM